jgi:orotidine-5'-phosphate decarboxylase
MVDAADLKSAAFGRTGSSPVVGRARPTPDLFSRISDLPDQPRALPADIAGRLILALDVPTIAEAQDLIRELDGVVSFFKIGMWLFFQPGADALIDKLIAQGKNVFLDYKMYDIGETVRRGVASVARRGAAFVTVHGDEAIMRAAAEGRGNSSLRILAISVLTSLDDAALDAMGYRLNVRQLIALRVRQAASCGVDGMIASAHEDANDLRREAGPGGERLLVVTPGVRRATDTANDHRRFADPAGAIRRGADYLVVGRPVLQASDRLKAAQEIIANMASGLQDSGTVDKGN